MLRAEFRIGDVAALVFARMILEQQVPALRSGATPVFALRFDMNLLRERYVAALFRRCRTPGLEVGTQESRAFWKPVGASARTIRPDVVVRRGERVQLIADTKWKLLDESCPSDADLQQMFAYNELFGARRSGSGISLSQRGIRLAECGIGLARRGTGLAPRDPRLQTRDRSLLGRDPRLVGDASPRKSRSWSQMPRPQGQMPRRQSQMPGAASQMPDARSRGLARQSRGLARQSRGSSRARPGMTRTSPGMTRQERRQPSGEHTHAPATARPVRVEQLHLHGLGEAE